MGQLGRLLLACRGLTLAAGLGEPGEAQLLVVGAQVALQAEGYLLVTVAQLLLTPAPFVSCGLEEEGGQCLPLPETESGVPGGNL